MKILLRPPRDTDYSDIAEIFRDEAVIGNTSQMPHRDERFWRKYHEKLGDQALIVVAEMDQRVVGHLSINPDTRPRRRHTAWFGLAVHPDYQSRGIGRALMDELIHQGDNWLNLTKIELGVFADNKRALALYRRYGFAEEGRLIDDIFKDGKYCDTVLMARFHPNHGVKK